TLNFANDYIVAATGKLLNETEVLPDTLREKLAIENFKDKAWGSSPSTIIERVIGERKEWHFYAENIHDFCFTANPHYRIGEHEWTNAEGRTIKTYSYAQEPHASGWQDAAEYSAKVIQVYSEDIGMYGYHKMIVADAKDGMEYPMITLDNGKSPTYKGLLAHEIGHNWFYGMMNNNETYRAFMDEGFTQFITAWSQERIDGIYTDLNEPKNNYTAHFRWDRPVKDDEVYYGYMRDACLHKDPQLNTHSDGFHGALRHGGGYGHVYYKTATMLYNLQYTLGDSLFLAAMQNYFDEWSFCHPYPEDFRNSIIRYTKVDLNWYFDQWLETNKTIDYSVKNVKAVKDSANTFEITFNRNGRMQMPIDFEVMDKEGRTFDYYIPNQYFKKETDAKTLPKWTGWDKLNPTYTATVTLPEAYEGEKVKIKKVTIDPSEILADNNILSNRTKGNIDWHFDAKVWNFPDWRKYHIYYRPDIWWNAYDGFKLGWHMNGNYMNRKHKFGFTGWYNTRLAQGNLPAAKFGKKDDDNKYFTNDRWSYNFWYETALDKFMPDTKMRIDSRYLDGLVLNQFTLSKYFNRNVKLSGSIKSMIRPEYNDLNYLLFPKEWGVNKWNNSLNIEVKHWFDFKNHNGEGIIDIDARASLSKDYNYHYLQAEYQGERKLWRLDLDTRVFGRLGVGENMPSESSLYFAGANGEEMVENKYVRAAGFYPNDWLGYGAETNHFHYGGGLNMRGYAGYHLVEQDNEGNTVAAY
ncbi:MAG: M1 family aminopeptidase, partial [Chitinophagales bacterium]